MNYGLIGYPLGHSFSPAFFRDKFAGLGMDASYTLFPLEDIRAFPALLQHHPEIRGLNVTIPYKELVIPYLDALTPEAREIGAVNCIRIAAGGHTTGFNTDITGFRESLRPLLQPWHTRALILGTGGASKAVKVALEQLGIAYRFVSRQPVPGGFTYEALNRELLQDYTLVINTTPLGMHPDTDLCPGIPYEAVGSRHLFYDLIYNPEETLFLRNGRAHGARVKNGQEMLVLQAEASWDIWKENAL